MISRERRAYGAAGVPCRGLNPDSFEFSIEQYLPVSDAIERDTARQAEILHARLRGERARESHPRFVEHSLNRCRHIHVTLRQPLVPTTRRVAEPGCAPAPRH